MDPKDYKVIFYSDDGEKFRLFCEGKEIAITRGITISAGNGEPVIVTPTLAFVPDLETLKEVNHESNNSFLKGAMEKAKEELSQQIIESLKKETLRSTRMHSS